MEQELNYGSLEGVHPDDRQQRLESYITAFEARQEFEVEYRLRRYDGVYRWVLDRAALQFNPDNSFAGYVGSCVDITQRKQAELNQQLLIKLDAQIPGLSDPDEMIWTTVSSLGPHLNLTLCSFNEIGCNLVIRSKAAGWV